MMRNARNWRVTQPTGVDWDEQRPTAVVVLLGWWGAKPAHLEKYAKLYRKIMPGVITVAGTAKTKSILMLDQVEIREHAQDCLDTISYILDQERADRTDPPLPVIVHMFSNGGGFVWQQMLKIFDETGKMNHEGSVGEATPLHTNTKDSRIRNRICAHVIDSCPAYPTWTTAAAALEGSGIAAQGGVLLLWLVLSAFFLMFLFEICWNWLNRRPSRLLVYWEDLKTSNWKVPQGFIYSGVDKMVDPVHLEEFIRYRKQHSSNVSVLRFEDSPHVQHFRVHPQEYEGFVQSFVTNSIASYLSQYSSVR